MIGVGAASKRWLVGALALSMIGHAASLLVLPNGMKARVSVRPSRVDLVELVIEPAPEPSVRVAPPEPEPPVRVLPPPPAETPAAIDTAENTPPPETSPPEATPPATDTAARVGTTPAPSDPGTATTEVPDPRVTGPRIDLSAANAARSVMVFDGPRQPRAAAAAPDVESPEARDRRLSSELSATLTTAANARPEGFGPRVLPPAVRRPDGTMTYALGQVTAIVSPDGSFTFDDTGGVHFDGMGSAERSGGVQASWGLEEWMMRRHGNDPHAATRRWFANQTQEMRDTMEQRYMERMARTHATRARARLDRILADEGVSLEMRRHRVFDVWDECAEGELVGDAVRAAVITYVREHLARGTENAYPESELDALNRGRTGTSEFRPYAP